MKHGVLPVMARSVRCDGLPDVGRASARQRPWTEIGALMTDVRAEITANVWQVPAEVGQTVAEGDELAILESMKMEIPVIAPVSGTITSVAVAPEDQVTEGDLIAVIDPA